jgi:hypothetical protein
MGQEWTAPISQLHSFLDRLRRERPGLGTALLFPSPVEPDKPVTYERVRCWLTKAERRAISALQSVSGTRYLVRPSGR